jgi:tubulin polyglutamylase TTLL6/13
MHLTNYAINKKSPKFIFNTSVEKMHIGHKRALTSVFKLIKR